MSVNLAHPATIEPASYIQTEAELDTFCREWLPRIDQHTIALDIEEERGWHYHPRVALIQISIDGQDAILDPIELDKPAMEPALEQILLTAKRIIVHGGRNDIAGMRRDFGLAPCALGDTQIAARFLGEPHFGLSALLEKYFGIVLDKEQRRSNWGQRPLTESQLRYAQRDTTWLEALWNQLLHACQQTSWLDALEEECEALRQTPAETYGFDPYGWLGIKKMSGRDLSIRQRASVLWWWRDHIGQEANIHPSQVLPKWAVEQAAIRGFDWLSTNRKVHKRLERVRTDALEHLRDVQASAPDLPLERPSSHHGPKPAVDADTLRERYEALRAWRQNASNTTGIDAGWLAPKSVLETIARATPNTLWDLENTSDVRTWRLTRYADTWAQILRDSS